MTIADALAGAVPAACGHKGGKLDGGQLRGLKPGTGGASVYESGKWIFKPKLFDIGGGKDPELVSVLDCNAGGVGWPQILLVYSPGPHLMGFVDLGAVTPAEHSSVMALTGTPSGLKVEWTSYDGCCFDQRYWSGTLEIKEGKVALVNLKQTAGARPPGRSIDYGVGDVAGFVTMSGNIVCQVSDEPPQPSVICDLIKGTFGASVPTRPNTCIGDWGNRLRVSGVGAAFICYSDAITESSVLHSSGTAWWDPARDAIVKTEWGDAAAPRPHSTFRLGEILCDIENESVSCHYGLAGPSFQIGPKTFGLQN